MSAVIDLESDELLPINEIAKVRLGKRLSPATLWRYRLRGIRGVKLEAVLAGGIWCTTPRAFAEFLRAVTAAANPTAAEADRTAEATRSRLEAEGLVTSKQRRRIRGTQAR